jgi:hypothetical protein
MTSLCRLTLSSSKASFEGLRSVVSESIVDISCSSDSPLGVKSNCSFMWTDIRVMIVSQYSRRPSEFGTQIRRRVRSRHAQDC